MAVPPEVAGVVGGVQCPLLAGHLSQAAPASNASTGCHSCDKQVAPYLHDSSETRPSDLQVHV